VNNRKAVLLFSGAALTTPAVPVAVVLSRAGDNPFLFSAVLGFGIASGLVVLMRLFCWEQAKDSWSLFKFAANGRWENESASGSAGWAKTAPPPVSATLQVRQASRTANCN